MAGLVHSPPTDCFRSLKVIGAGYPRTATSSFTLALEILLKAPVLHSGSACLVREESFIKSWIRILNEPDNRDQDAQKQTRATLRSLCAGYVGITDAPGVLFIGELVEEYPDAIIICTQRDPENWWKSFEAVSKSVFFIKALNLVLYPLPTVRFFEQWVDGLSKRHNIVYNGGKDYVLGRDHLEKHYDYLRRVTPLDRLFFYNVKDGWEPLCKILNMPVPDAPFPHANDAEAVQEFMASFIKKALLRWLMIFMTFGVALGSIWWMVK